MIDPCQYCASERVAAVLDKRIEESPTAGNKYRKRCLACERWLPMCSAGDFQTAEHQHVLPRSADPDEDDPTVPVEEFEGEVKGLASASGGGSAPEIRTDGGQDEPEDDGEEEENTFDCPSCGGEVVGYPDECPHDGCSVPYNWDTEERDD